MKSTSKLSIKLLSKNSSDNLASCSNWELIEEMCQKCKLSLIIAKWHTFCVIHHQSQMWQLKILICSRLDKTSDWLIVNLESIMLNTTQFTYSPVSSRSHPRTQVKVARGINKHNIKPWMKICLRRLQEWQNKERVF